MKKSIILGATSMYNGPAPEYAPTAAVSIERASRLYTFLINNILSFVDTEDAAVAPCESVLVVPNLIIFSNFVFACMRKKS